MEARKLLYIAMAFAPVILMAAIGIHARTYVDPFEWPNTTGDQARMNAYLPLVIETSKRLEHRHSATESDARHIASLWIEGGQSGKFKPLIPVAADELVPSSNKGKVFDNNGFVARRLMEFADVRIEAGQFKEAAIDLSLASDSLQALRYSSFMHLFRTSLLQSNILRRIEIVYPHLDSSTRSSIVACMNRMKGDRKEFEAIARRAKVVIREQLHEHADADKVAALASSMVPERSFFEQPALAKGLPGSNEVADQSEFAFPNQRIEAAQCMETDERNRLMIRKIMSLKVSSSISL